MAYIFTIINVLLVLFALALLTRIIFEWVQSFARQWRPRGVSLLAVSVIYGVTDPPVKLLRKVLPPINLGAISLDVGVMVIFIITWLLWSFTLNFAA